MTLAWMEKPWVELACRWALGGVFVYASIEKILHPAEFAKVVYDYRLLPLPASNLVAIGLPWAELFSGLALLMGVLRAEAALVLSGLLIVFIAALSINLVRGVDIACGCLTLSGAGRSIGAVSVIEDLLLLGAALPVLRRAMAEERADARRG